MYEGHDYGWPNRHRRIDLDELAPDAIALGLSTGHPHSLADPA